MKKLFLSLLTIIMLLCTVGLTACINLGGKCEHKNTQKSTVLEATCSQTGLEKTICSDCDKVLSEKTISKLNHSESGWIIQTQASCQSTGSKHKKCTECEEVLETQIVSDAYEHNYVNGECIGCGDEEASHITEGLEFSLINNDTEYSVTAYTGSSTEVFIPGTYEGKPVTSIGDGAFADCLEITSVRIPNSVKVIGYSVFFGCSSLTSITIPESVTSISDAAFLCVEPKMDENAGPSLYSSLTNIIVKEGNDAYKSVDGVLYSKDGKTLLQYPAGKQNTAFTIPNSVESIGNSAIICDSLINVNFEQNSQLVNIGDSAFYYCESLTSITIPSGVTSIGDEAFYNCISLTSITIPNSVTSIGEGAFEGCISLTSITIPNSVTSISGYAFYYCESLTSITIPNGVTSIGEDAFAYCESLTSIMIPNSVTSIGEDAFYYCDSLQYNIEGNLKYLGNSENPYLYLAGTTSDDITSATINTNCKFIGSSAFFITSLTSIVIPNSVTSIGDSAFEGCYNLISIEIPNSVTSIGDSAFEGCYSLQYTIEGNLKYLGNNSNPYLYLAGTTSDDITSATINANCKFIGSSAFYYCESLTSITIPNGVTSIGEDAFAHCESLTSITIPNSVTSIDDFAFYSCSSLTSIVIPESVEAISSYAFGGCSLLTIYCEAESEPSGWSAWWNSDNRPVVWGDKGESQN